MKVTSTCNYRLKLTIRAGPARNKNWFVPSDRHDVSSLLSQVVRPSALPDTTHNHNSVYYTSYL